MLDRARERSRGRELQFTLTAEDIYIPPMCAVRLVPLKCGEGIRGPESPSLDRIDPDRGYTPDNVRVISDAANRWKGDLTFAQLNRRAARSPGSKFEKLLRYVDRALRTESLLSELKARLGPRGAIEAVNVARFLRARELTSSGRDSIAGRLEQDRHTIPPAKAPGRAGGLPWVSAPGPG